MQTGAWRCDGVQWVPTSTRKAAATTTKLATTTTESTTTTTKPTATEPATAAVSTERADRAVITATMREALEHAYSSNPYPSTDARVALAQTLGLTERNVRFWFQNRRSRRDHHVIAAAKKEREEATMRTLIKFKEQALVRSLIHEQAAEMRRMHEQVAEKTQARVVEPRVARTPRTIDEIRSRKAASARGARLRRKKQLTDLQDEVARLRARAAELEALERAQSYLALVRELDAVLTPEQMRTLSEWCA